MAYVCTAERLGIKKGIAMGMEKGMEKGLEKASILMKQIVLLLIKKGISENEIMRETGLTQEQIDIFKQNEVICMD